MKLAGIDQNGPFLGAAAIDTLVGLMHTRTTGVPERPVQMVCQGEWVAGDTLRRVGEAKARGNLYETALSL